MGKREHSHTLTSRRRARLRDPRDQLKAGPWDRAWASQLRRSEDRIREELRDSRATTIQGTRILPPA